MNLLLERLRKLSDFLPCLTVLAGITGGVAALYLIDYPSTSLIFSTALCFLLPAWFLLGTRRALIRFALPMCAAIFSTLYTLHQRSEAFSQEWRFWNWGRVGIELQVRLCDPCLTGGIPEWMPAFTNNTEAEVRAFRYNDAEPWKKCHAKIFISLPRTAKAPAYGDLWQISGRLEQIVKNEIPGAFDFYGYALARGIEWRMYCNSAEKIKNGEGMMHQLFRIRGTLLSSFAAGMKEQSSRELAAAIIFGMKQCPAAAEKEDFRQSGTIHLLSVSGLHISLIFGVLAFFLKAAPFRFRFLLTLLPVLLYALVSGMQNPVMRALLMFSVWCISRSLCIRTPALNSILFAASVMLLLNPYLWLDTGFQYSFLCVLFLLTAFRFFSDLRTALQSPDLYRPLVKRHRFRRWLKLSLADMIAASATAWLCSTAISLNSQGLFTVYAVPAYLLMSIPAWFGFLLFTLGTVFCFIPGFTALCGKWMGLCFQGILLTADFFSQGSHYPSVPPVWFVPAFLSILLLTLLFRKRIYAVLSGILLLILLLTAAIAMPYFRSNKLFIICEGGNAPTYIFAEPSENKACILTMPDIRTAQKTAGLLSSIGVHSVEEMSFLSMSRSECGGGIALLNRMPVRAISFQRELSGNSLYGPKLLAAVENARGRVRPEKDSVFKIQNLPSKRLIRCQAPGWKSILIQQETVLSGIRVQVFNRGKLVRDIEFPFSPDMKKIAVPE